MKEVYQIKAIGVIDYLDECDRLSTGLITRFSQEVYINPPLEEDIQKFVNDCCSIGETFIPMDIDTIEPSIIKLTVIQ